jgi:hypothetical protein
METTGDIYLVSEKGRCVVYWRPADGSRSGFSVRRMQTPAASIPTSLSR